MAAAASDVVVAMVFDGVHSLAGRPNGGFVVGVGSCAGLSGMAGR